MIAFTSMLLPAEMQVHHAEPGLRPPSGSPAERRLALAAVGLASAAALVTALLLG